MNTSYYSCVVFLCCVKLVSLVVPEHFDLRNLNVTKGIILKRWDFQKASPLLLLGCYKLCSRFSACKSVSYMADYLVCSLNLKRAAEVPDDVVEDKNGYYITKGNLDQMLQTPCKTSSCSWDEICIQSKYGAASCIKNRKCAYNESSTILMEITGFIRSINYPSTYPKYSNQKFTITGPIGMYIEVTFITFNLEPSYDFLTIHDGCSPLSPLLVRYSGNIVPKPINTTYNYAWVQFKADGYTQKTGFEIKYELRSVQ